MNEQIQELIKQCTTYYNGGLGTEIEVFDKEKFARLIVFECIKIAVFRGDSVTGKAIKEHFGVNE
jgi:hypothetical protein